MRYLMFLAATLLLVTACRKENHNNVPSFKDRLTSQLRDSLDKEDFENLELSKSVITKYKDSRELIRIPFKGKRDINEFLLVRADAIGNIRKCIIIDFERDTIKNIFTFNGHIRIYSRKRELLIESSIERGYITTFHQLPIPRRHSRGPWTVDRGPSSPSGIMLEPDPYDWLPEVVVTATIDRNNEINFSTYLALSNVLDQASGFPDGGAGDYPEYSPLDPSSGGGGGGGDGAPGPDPIELEPEYASGQPSVDLAKYFACFNQVPSPGASYTIKLCTDIPVNNHPDMMLSLSNGVGHVFLSITKANATASVTQSFGFFTNEPLPAFTPFVPVSSKMIDNGLREVNASIQMNLTEDQFGDIKEKALLLADHQYDLANYNCADYAIEIFNTARSIPIQVAPCYLRLPAVSVLPPVDVTIHRSPQTLFQKLNEMKKQGGAEAANITIDQSHSTISPVSKGACQ